MENNIIEFIVIFNFIISIIILLVLLGRKEKEKGFMLFVFMLTCPLIGPCFLLLSRGLKLLFYKKEIDMEDLSFHTENLEMIIGPDFNKEINVVPVEEALLISDNFNKRRVILDVLKEDYNNSLIVITSALESEDSETSHYVASVIADVKSNFKVTVQKMQENSEKYPEDIEIRYLLIDYIHQFLVKNVLSEIEEITYIQQYMQLMEDLFYYHKEAVTGRMYKQVIYHLLKIGNSSAALLWGERALNENINDLEAYKGILKLYYETGNKFKFFEILNKLKKSDIEFDNECIELVRYYQV
ncbi:MAG: hypothetical protein WCD89_06790 [Anaerocolumna sp.]